jgi:ferric-dicitrate binding protein FerR (iron transport regulator)
VNRTDAWQIYLDSTEIEKAQRMKAQEWLDEAEMHYDERRKCLAVLNANGVPFEALALNTGLAPSKVQRMVERGRALLAEQDVPVEV